MKLKFIMAVLCLCSAGLIYAETNYKVSSSSRLNVRKTPTTNGVILGTFKSGQEITVLSIDKGWAKVEYHNTIGYVSARYITELPKQVEVESIENEEIVEIIEEVNDERPVCVSNSHNDNEDFSAPLTIGSSLTDKLNIYFAVQGGGGYSNFVWSDGNVNGTISYSVDIAGQLYFEDNISFIPRNWYSEFAMGYDKKGAANFGMNYIHARVYPLGYRIQLSPVNIVVKGGVSLGIPLNDLETSTNSWSSDFQCGIGCGFQIEWKQFAVGCIFEYDFTEVSSSCNQTLNNMAVLGTISYKFAQLGHKK